MRLYLEPHKHGPGAAIWESFPDCRSARNFPSVLDALDAFADLLLGPRCVECHEPIRHGYMESTEAAMAARGVCLECLSFLALIEGTDRYSSGPYKRQLVERRVIADGRYYQVERDLPEHLNDCAGYGGARLVIRFHDGRELRTRNLWDRGVIPACFRDRLPDNATIQPAESL